MAAHFVRLKNYQKVFDSMKKLSQIVMLVVIGMFAFGCSAATDAVDDAGSAVGEAATAAGDAAGDAAAAAGVAVADGAEALGDAVEGAADAAKEAVTQ